MEPQKEVTKKSKEGEDGRARSSSASDFSSDEHGSTAHELEYSVKGTQPEALESGASSSLELPPTQVMERPPDSSGYRIPSYVFARNKSNTPNADWSTASNESLFSIHTGNMSFTREQFNFLTKSGELGGYGDLRKSGEIPPLSPNGLSTKSGELPPTCKDLQNSGEQIIAAHFNAPPSSLPAVNKIASSPRVSEASAMDLATVAKKEDNKQIPKPSIEEIPFSASTVSHHSDASNQSFAFPVLTDIDRQKSENSGASRVEQPKEAGTPTEKEAKQKSPKSTAESAPPSSSSSWLSCFSCCSCWTSKQS